MTERKKNGEEGGESLPEHEHEHESPFGKAGAGRISRVSPPPVNEAVAGFLRALKRTVMIAGLVGAVGTIFLWSVWHSVFYYVPPGKILVLTTKTGKDLPPGQLLAKRGEKGIQEEVLGEGRHFIMPVLNEVELKDAVEIAAGEVGIVKASVGVDLKPGQILADEGQKGIRRRVLPPGRHRLNPHGYSVEKHPAIVIRPGYVGFVTALVGLDLRPGEVLAGEGERGPRANVLPPGIYYLNPYEVHVDEVEVGINQISFLDKTRIAFPSSDAFPISLEATVEWELEPRSVAPVMKEFGSREAIEKKIIDPQSKSIGRLEGSLYSAEQFLLGEGREKFQNAFTKELVRVAKEKNVEVHSAFIRHIDIPAKLLKPIQAAFIAVQKEQTAKRWEETRQSAAQLAGETALITQREQEVEAQTNALLRKINAQAGQDVGKIEAETRRLVAEKQQEIATLDAQRTLALGQADAEVQKKLGEARAQLFGLKVAAFGGDAAAFRRYTFAMALPDDLAIRLVQQGQGTLWTDLVGTAGADDVARAKILKGK